MPVLRAGACSATCNLTAQPSQFVFHFAYDSGRVMLGMPPLGFPPSWQLQVRCARALAIPIVATVSAQHR